MNPELMDPELQIGRTDFVPDRGGSEHHVGLLAILAQLGYLLLDLDRQRDLLEHPFEIARQEGRGLEGRGAHLHRGTPASCPRGSDRYLVTPPQALHAHRSVMPPAGRKAASCHRRDARPGARPALGANNGLFQETRFIRPGPDRALSPPTPFAGVPRGRRVCRREPNADGGTMSRLGLDGELAAEQLDTLLDPQQAEARTPSGGAGGLSPGRSQHRRRG